MSFLSARWFRSAVVCCVLMSFCGSVAADEGPLADLLYSQGLGPVDGQMLPLKRPLLAGVAEEARLELAKTLPKRMPWKRFAGDSVFAPVSITVKAIKDADGTRLAHDVQCAFVVHARIDDLQDKVLMESIMVAGDKDNSGAGGQEVPAQVLEKLGINASQDAAFVTVKMPLFNRVELTGVIQAEKQAGEGWIGVVWQFDPRFTHANYENAWRRLEKDNLGQPVVGPPKAYAGCGGTMTITQLDATGELLLVESRIVMHEPADWFNGSSFLRAKLPTALQENARSFRRKLAKAKAKSDSKKEQ